MNPERKSNLVLVADDNDFIRFLIRKWLGESAEVVEIRNGKDVAPAYRRLNPAMVFLDIHLPGRSGKEILRDILKMDPAAFVVMVSADSKRENVVETINGGARAFMTKPFTRTTLDRYFRMCPAIRVPEGASLAST